MVMGVESSLGMDRAGRRIPVARERGLSPRRHVRVDALQPRLGIVGA